MYQGLRDNDGMCCQSVLLGVLFNAAVDFFIDRALLGVLEALRQMYCVFKPSYIAALHLL